MFLSFVPATIFCGAVASIEAKELAPAYPVLSLVVDADGAAAKEEGAEPAWNASQQEVGSHHSSVIRRAVAWPAGSGSFAQQEQAAATTVPPAPSTVPPVPSTVGPPGPPGSRGPVGPPGSRGKVGARGATGPEGDQGFTGVRGDPGEIGEKGATGPTGDKGATGNVGDKGAAGPTNPPAAPPRGLAKVQMVFALIGFNIFSGIGLFVYINQQLNAKYAHVVAGSQAAAPSPMQDQEYDEHLQQQSHDLYEHADGQEKR
mmetsp:Transcript_19452/g.45650  ORF Transcript_19452/g.45650 Transcript_19452/m.45650 type:complete len:259 (-) Transcript_19452:80-856(-)